MMDGEFTKRNIKATLDSQDGTMLCWADPARLKQVFANIVINAVQAMPEGGSLLISLRRIGAKGLSQPSVVEVSIKDTGVGIALDVLEHIFEPFHTFRPGGTGLGLSIARDIVEQHGGDIYAESQPNGGCCFIVKLPMEATEAAKPTWMI